MHLVSQALGALSASELPLATMTICPGAKILAMEPVLSTSTHWPMAPDRSAVKFHVSVRTYSRCKIGRRLAVITRQAATACYSVSTLMRTGSKQAPCDMPSRTCSHYHTLWHYLEPIRHFSCRSSLAFYPLLNAGHTPLSK